ncbi:MAG: hydroxymethylbilane synthase [Gammaproteobacteria bacterium]
MMPASLIIATRKSPLALWQAYWVKAQLEYHYRDLKVSLLPLTTTGDVYLEQPLAAIGGKGLFIKELEQALLDGRAHIAVHSMKDVPAVLPEPFVLEAILERQDPRDAFVANEATAIEDLPHGAIVGTASLRRQSQLLALRSDLMIKTLRGNVGTRLRKLEEEEYDAIILAAAGLHRLEEQHRITAYIPQDMMVPAVGQGAMGIECLVHDEAVRRCVSVLNHPDTVCCVTAERAMNKVLNGSCHVPIGGYAVIKDGVLQLQGFVGSIDGVETLYEKQSGKIEKANALGEAVACALLQRGAKELIANDE